jgi:hypothetical protein
MPTRSETDGHTYCLYPDSMPDWGIANIVLAEDENGLLFFPVRTLCLGICIDSPTQVGIIRGDAGLKAESRDIKLPSGRSRHVTLCLTKMGVAKWLARIDPNRVGDHAKGRLTEYQADLWDLATRLVFSRKRVVDAGVEDLGEVIAVTGTERIELDCDCGQRHVLEKTDGIWRHRVMPADLAR